MHEGSCKGFTLVEALVVIALIGIIGSFGLLMSYDVYRGDSFRTDRAALIAALQHARAESMGAVCFGDTCTDGAEHGIAIQSDRYVIFQGSSYAARDAEHDVVVAADPSFAHGGLSEVVFAMSSGNPEVVGAITFQDTTGRASIITIGNEGQIACSN